MRAAALAFSAVFALLIAGAARADEANCPAGSSQKQENGLTWCEPSVCESDANCKTGEVCRQVPLCVEIGAMPGDAGKKLMVRQRCGTDKSCPQTTTCSDMKRCVSRADADKMAPAPSASAAAPSGEPAKKSSCGCHVPGAPASTPLGVGLALGVGLVLGARRRR